MILILSQAECETSTEEVMDWLERLGTSYIRLNGEDLDGGAVIRVEISGKETDLRLVTEDNELQLTKARAVWYRRWLSDRRHDRATLLTSRVGERLHFDIKRHLTLESRRLSSFLFARFADLPWLSDPESSQLDKLRALELAAEAGLTTPATLVTSERRQVQQFAKAHGTLITKPISEAQIFLDEEWVHFMYTSVLDRAAVDELPEHFVPSLFQEKVEKKFELRVFYLDGDCNAMAIFSQLDSQTQADFRRYNHTRPNRNVPYRLSPVTVGCIQRLMARLRLETGSLDLIRTPEGRDVFLEINPIGQFGMVSKPCNYQLERKIAEALIRKAEHGQEH